MKDKRIAFYHREFRLCEWPEKPTTSKFDDGWDEYYKAVTSAMENGIPFDQEKIKSWFWDNQHLIPTVSRFDLWQPKEGDNWDCPENVEIVERCQHKGIHNSTCIYSKVAVLKSEIEILAVEKGKDIIRNRSVNAKESESVEKKRETQMTHKEEIREAAKIDYKAVEREAYWLAEQKFEDTFIQAVRYVRFVKFLASKNIIAAPELTAPESSPAPLESQEELWKEFWESVPGKDGKYKAKFILTRRTEGKGRTEGDLQE